MITERTFINDEETKVAKALLKVTVAYQNLKPSNPKPMFLYSTTMPCLNVGAELRKLMRQVSLNI